MPLDGSAIVVHEPAPVVGGVEFSDWAEAPSSFTNLLRSWVASNSRTGRKRHRRSRTCSGRASRGTRPLPGSATSVVVPEPVAVVGRVEVALNRSEPPVPWLSERERERERVSGTRQVSAVEAGMLFDLAPDAESGSCWDLGEGRGVRPPGELRYRHKFRLSVHHGAELDRRTRRAGIDSYMWLIGVALKATPVARLGG